MIGRAVRHRLLYTVGIDCAETQLTEGERECLARVASGRHRIVEIGVYEGASTNLMVRAAAADAEVLGIDPFIPGRLGVCWAKGIAEAEIRRAQRMNPRVRVHLLRRYSFDAAREVAGDFDLVFIDGDHSLEGITRDWDDWSVKVRPGGLIALHDTRLPSHLPDSAKLGSHEHFEAVIRNDERFALREQVDSLSVMERLQTLGRAR